MTFAIRDSLGIFVGLRGTSNVCLFPTPVWVELLIFCSKLKLISGFKLCLVFVKQEQYVFTTPHGRGTSYLFIPSVVVEIAVAATAPLLIVSIPNEPTVCGGRPVGFTSFTFAFIAPPILTSSSPRGPPWITQPGEWSCLPPNFLVFCIFLILILDFREVILQLLLTQKSKI